MQDPTITTYPQIYQDYAQRNVMNANLKPLLDKYISFMSGKKILDIGCTNGRDSCYFLDKGFDVYGIDLTPEVHLPKSISLNEWANMLKENIVYLLQKELSFSQIQKLVNSLLPYYFIRVITYFDEIENATTKQIEKIFIKQKSIIIINKDE